MKEHFLEKHFKELNIDYEIISDKKYTISYLFKINNKFYTFGTDKKANDYTLSGYCYETLEQRLPDKVIHEEYFQDDAGIRIIMIKFFKIPRIERIYFETITEDTIQKETTFFDKFVDFLITLKNVFGLNVLSSIFNHDEHNIVSKEGWEKIIK